MSEQQEYKPSAGRTIFNILSLTLLTWYLCSTRPGKNPQFQLQECGKSLHTLGVALERERLSSETGLYPTDLSSVLSEEKFPACPNGGKQAYLDGYKLDEDRRAYHLSCKGSHHSNASLPANYPRIAFSIDQAEGGSAEEGSDDGAAPPPPESSPAPQVSPDPLPAASPEPTATDENTDNPESPSISESPSP